MAKKKDKKEDKKKRLKKEGGTVKKAERVEALHVRVEVLEKQVLALAGALDEALRGSSDA